MTMQQLDWVKFADWAYVIMFAVDAWFQIQGQFWIPNQKLHRAYFEFFCKSQNEIVWHFLLIFGIFRLKTNDCLIIANLQ